jgi:hypothetical protein
MGEHGTNNALLICTSRRLEKWLQHSNVTFELFVYCSPYAQIPRYCVRSNVHTTTTMKGTISWDEMPSSLVK